jgi:exosome complex RNA-binding protein Rrp4
LIKEFISFEVAVGRNGKIWLSTKFEKNLIILYNLIKKVESQNFQEIQGYVKSVGKMFITENYSN